MAHKHNRRRVRPRVRQNRQNYYTNNMSYDTLSLHPQFISLPNQYSQSLIPRSYGGIPQHITGIADQQPLPKLLSSKNNIHSLKSAITVESERIKMFGGEPGESEMDHIGLCFKMVDVFEEMDWINV